jgi:hypothetical protein
MEAVTTHPHPQIMAAAATAVAALTLDLTLDQKTIPTLLLPPPTRSSRPLRPAAPRRAHPLHPALHHPTQDLTTVVIAPAPSM